MRKEILVNDQQLNYGYREEAERVIIEVDGQEFIFSHIELDDDQLHFAYKGQRFSMSVATKGSSVFCDIAGKAFHAKKMEKNFSKSAVGAGEGLVTPMPGKIIKICFSVGDKIKAGDAVVVMEAMKMEHTLSAPKDGTIKAIHASEGELVDGGISVVDLGDRNDSGATNSGDRSDS